MPVARPVPIPINSAARGCSLPYSVFFTCSVVLAETSSKTLKPAIAATPVAANLPYGPALASKAIAFLLPIFAAGPLPNANLAASIAALVPAPKAAEISALI